MGLDVEVDRAELSLGRARRTKKPILDVTFGLSRVAARPKLETKTQVRGGGRLRMARLFAADVGVWVVDSCHDGLVCRSRSAAKGSERS